MHVKRKAKFCFVLFVAVESWDLEVCIKFIPSRGLFLFTKCFLGCCCCFKFSMGLSMALFEK